MKMNSKNKAARGTCREVQTDLPSTMQTQRHPERQSKGLPDAGSAVCEEISPLRPAASGRNDAVGRIALPFGNAEATVDANGKVLEYIYTLLFITHLSLLII